jgi:hypothetical protein
MKTPSVAGIVSGVALVAALLVQGSPAFAGGQAIGADTLRRTFMVPKPVELRPTTPAEAEAHAVWTLRAALNVAALQCQYSPFLRTVKNYNEFLRHHSGELARAQSVMIGHFRRHDGPRGNNSFDQYNTRTYNSFSTLDAQSSFCTAAGKVGRDVLGLQRGQLGSSSRQLVPELRASLEAPPLPTALDLSWLASRTVPPLSQPAPERRRRRA